jgi:hypothetical protein
MKWASAGSAPSKSAGSAPGRLTGSVLEVCYQQIGRFVSHPKKIAETIF